MTNFSPTTLLDRLNTYPAVSALWIAYSGGVDSHVLLHALAQLPLQIPVRAVHLHHHLHPHADQWATHCQRVCEALKLSCQIIHLKIPTTEGNIEARARRERYAALAACLNTDSILLTAHQADDQAETVLLQLLRGAGVAGLAAMPALTRLGRGWLGRPLLDFKRSQLVVYAKQFGLNWIEDPSNQNTCFDRNFLRHEMIPRLQQRWPSVNRVLQRVAHHQAEAHDLLRILAEQDLKTCVADLPTQLSIPPLTQLEPARQRNLLRYWLKRLHLSMPPTSQLQRILDEVLTAGADRQPLVRWEGAEVHRYQNRLVAMPNLPPLPTQELTWSFPEPLQLPLGTLTATLTAGRGLTATVGTVLHVKFRQGGERCLGRGLHRSVKKWIQDAKIPPWQRPFLPLIYNLHGQLVAIADKRVCDHFSVAPEETGWVLHWCENNENYQINTIK